MVSLLPRTTHYAVLVVRTTYYSLLPTPEASVVFLFLLPGLNARLRPRLAAQLRPGARVLSAHFQASHSSMCTLAHACAVHSSMCTV